jgi:hypothetical protein
LQDSLRRHAGSSGSSDHRLPRTSLLSSGAQVDWVDHLSHTFHASFKPRFPFWHPEPQQYTPRRLVRDRNVALRTPLRHLAARSAPSVSSSVQERVGREICTRRVMRRGWRRGCITSHRASPRPYRLDVRSEFDSTRQPAYDLAERLELKSEVSLHRNSGHPQRRRRRNENVGIF